MNTEDQNTDDLCLLNVIRAHPFDGHRQTHAEHKSYPSFIRLATAGLLRFHFSGDEMEVEAL